MTDFYLRFVRHAHVSAFESMGWRLAGNGSGLGSHANWSVLMRFDGDTPPDPLASPVPSLPQHSGECAQPT